MPSALVARAFHTRSSAQGTTGTSYIECVDNLAKESSNSHKKEWVIVAPLRQQLKDFVAICDSLIALHHKEELSSAERAIVEYYIKELPTLLKERGS